MAAEGKYIYCIIETKGKSEQFGPLGIGGRGDLVYAFSLNDVAVVISDAPIKKYSVSRENLIPHERVIEEVMKSYDVLPVRFATIAENEDKLKKILDKEHDRFVRLLKQIEGKKELGLKVIFREEVIYADILAGYDGIRRQKENLQKGAAQRIGLIEIGRQVEAALAREKAKYQEDLLHCLAGLALDVKINPSYGERMIMNAAFLVERAKESMFDIKVNELAEQFADKMKFKYVGMVPPFNFVNIEINTGEY